VLVGGVGKELILKVTQSSQARAWTELNNHEKINQYVK
jgi:hypothetical protein